MTDMPDDVPQRIEHTVLGPEATEQEVALALFDAETRDMGVCVPPLYVNQAVKKAWNAPVATVANFPHGTSDRRTVASEVKELHITGAQEVDVVAPTSLLKSDDISRYKRFLETAAGSAPVVKIIVEAPLLTGSELEIAGRLVKEAGADFIKTATGYHGETEPEHVEVLSQYLPVKASGGIRTWKDAEEMFEAGAERIGTSSGVEIVDQYHQQS